MSYFKRLWMERDELKDMYPVPTMPEQPQPVILGIDPAALGGAVRYELVQVSTSPQSVCGIKVTYIPAKDMRK